MIWQIISLLHKMRYVDNFAKSEARPMRKLGLASKLQFVPRSALAGALTAGIFAGIGFYGGFLIPAANAQPEEVQKFKKDFVKSSNG